MPPNSIVLSGKPVSGSRPRAAWEPDETIAICLEKPTKKGSERVEVGDRLSPFRIPSTAGAAEGDPAVDQPGVVYAHAGFVELFEPLEPTQAAVQIGWWRSAVSGPSLVGFHR